MTNAEQMAPLGVAEETNESAIEEIQQALSALDQLPGLAWSRIREADRRGQNANPRNENRHLLALLAEQAEVCIDELQAHRGFAYLPQSVALRGIVHLLKDWRRDPSLADSISSFENAAAFRHGMVALAYAENARQNGWMVRWAPLTGLRNPPDLYLVDPRNGEIITVEVKSPEPFGGLLQPVSPAMARKGVEQAWDSALQGRRRQLPQDKESILVTGGPSLPFESLDVIRTAAKELLEARGGNRLSPLSRGASRPYLHSIAVLTTWTARSGPPLQQVGTRLQGSATIRFAVGCKYALNRSYAGRLRPPLLDSPEVLAKEREGGHRSVGWPDREAPSKQ